MNRTTAPITAVRLERVIPAPPRDVYSAWLDPDLLRRWMAPGGITVKQAAVEPRVGGCFRIWHQEAGADVGGFECEILELVPDTRIVFRWGMGGPERTAGPVYDSRLTVTFQAATEGGTLLTLVHERLEDLAAALPHVARNVEAGWRLVLEKLAVVLGESDRRGASNENV